MSSSASDNKGKKRKRDDSDTEELSEVKVSNTKKIRKTSSHTFDNFNDAQKSFTFTGKCGMFTWVGMPKRKDLKDVQSYLKIRFGDLLERYTIGQVFTPPNKCNFHAFLEFKNKIIITDCGKTVRWEGKAPNVQPSPYGERSLARGRMFVENCKFSLMMAREHHKCRFWD
jgi:hypothetical protein